MYLTRVGCQDTHNRIMGVIIVLAVSCENLSGCMLLLVMNEIKKKKSCE